jgi:hypothetical protein
MGATYYKGMLKVLRSISFESPSQVRREFTKREPRAREKLKPRILNSWITACRKSKGYGVQRITILVTETTFFKPFVPWKTVKLISLSHSAHITKTIRLTVYQAVEAYRFVTRRGSYILLTIGLQMDVSLTSRLSLPLGRDLVLVSVRGRVDPSSKVRCYFRVSLRTEDGRVTAGGRPWNLHCCKTVTERQ